MNMYEELCKMSMSQVRLQGNQTTGLPRQTAPSWLCSHHLVAHRSLHLTVGSSRDIMISSHLCLEPTLHFLSTLPVFTSPLLLAASPLPANTLTIPSSHSFRSLLCPPVASCLHVQDPPRRWASPGSISLLTTSLTVLTAFPEYSFPPYFTHLAVWRAG